jgi:phosphoribosyl-dephospho-CoA transferase
MIRPDRHRFILLGRAWRDHVVEPTILAQEPAAGVIEDWIDAGRPLVVAASAKCDPPGSIRLGIATLDKRRFGVVVRPAAVDRLLPELGLEAVVASTPLSWRDKIAQTLEVAAQQRLTLTVFGSVAWAHLTGEPYLRESSDLDLAVMCHSATNIVEAANALLSIEGSPRLDPELCLSGRGGVNLKELAMMPEHILLKRHGGPMMVDASAVIRALACQ